MHIAKAAIAAGCKTYTLAFNGQIGDYFFALFIQNFGADGHAQHNISAIAAKAVLAHAALTVLGKEMLLIAKVDQRVQPGHRLGINRAAIAAATTIWPAKFDEFFTAKADSPIAAGARAYINFG